MIKAATAKIGGAALMMKREWGRLVCHKPDTHRAMSSPRQMPEATAICRWRRIFHLTSADIPLFFTLPMLIIENIAVAIACLDRLSQTGGLTKCPVKTTNMQRHCSMQTVSLSISCYKQLKSV